MKELQEKSDLIIEMLLTLCGRNMEISFSETNQFKRRWEEIIESHKLPDVSKGVAKMLKNRISEKNTDDEELKNGD